MMLKPGQAAEDVDPYAGRVFQIYRRGLEACIRRRWLTIAVVVGFFLLALQGFGFVDQSFFPDSTRPQFLVEFWRPEGSHILDTAADLAEIDEWVRSLEGVTSTATFSGQGSLRFLLTFSPEDVNSAYGLIVVSVEDWREVDDLRSKIEEHIAATNPGAQAWTKKFMLGPGGEPRSKPSSVAPTERCCVSLRNRPRASCGRTPQPSTFEMTGGTRLR